MSPSPTTAPAILGNTRTVAIVEPDGTLGWLALPTPDVPPVFNVHAPPPAASGRFTLAARQLESLTREYIGETAVLRTLVQTATGTANVVEFLAMRPGASAASAKVPHDRYLRVVEGLTGEVAFDYRLEPVPHGEGAPEFDPNGVLFPGHGRRLVLQTETHAVADGSAVRGELAVRAGENRHFVLTMVPGTDPDVPEMKVTEPEWDLDGTLDFWLGWGRSCPFKGVQRDHVVRLAARLKAAWLPYGQVAVPPLPGVDYEAFRALAPVALAAWGWEENLEAALAGYPALGERADGLVAALMAAWLQAAQESSLLSASTFYARWPAWAAAIARMAHSAEALTGQSLSLADWRERAVPLAAGLDGAASLSEELLLEGDAPAWRALARRLLDRAPGAWRLEDEAFDAALAAGQLREAIAAVEAELAEGGYLQARRRMDRWLLAHDPFSTGTDLVTDCRALFLAARLYLVEPPTPPRVHLPGDLGE